MSLSLILELHEELNVHIDASDLSPFGTVFALVVGHTDKYLRMDVFLVRRWEGEITPTSDVEEIAWIDSHVPSTIELGSIFRHDVLPKLKAQNLID